MSDMSGMNRGNQPTEDRVGKVLVIAATVLAALFMLLGLIVFFGSWSSAKEVVGDDVWVQLNFVGQGALPYFIGGGVLWLLAEYKTNNPTP